MLWLGVHFPLLPLEVFAGCGKAQTAQPVQPVPTVVVDDRGRVILLDAAAGKAGIAPGSTLATAHSILPGLAHYRRDRERERQRLELLAGALYGFSSRVSLALEAAADAPPCGITLEIGGSLSLFGNATELARQVETVCHGMGHEVRVRRAATPLAALVLARSGAADLERVPLAHAAVEPQRLTAEHVERFANMGIHDLGQLLALPRRGLAKRFGEALVDYLARLTGERPDPRPGIRPAERFQSALHLLEPLNSKETLAFPMQRLLGDLQHWLVARQLGAEQLRWHFTGSGSARAPAGHPHRNGNRNGNGNGMTVRFARAQQSREAFLDITRLQLAATDLPEDVVSLSLEARRLVPWASVSHAASPELFGNLPELQSMQPGDSGELVDQLRARLGPSACCTLKAEDQHTPEHAWRRTAPLQPPEGRAAAKPAEDAWAHLRRRPLWLFDQPRPVERRQLELLKGPERVHTGWWIAADRGPPAQARDYYVARHANGARCWVFVDPRERWFLHGYFA